MSNAGELSFLKTISLATCQTHHFSDPLEQGCQSIIPYNSTHKLHMLHALYHTTILCSISYAGVHGFRFGCKLTTLIQAFDGANQLGNGN